MSGRFKVLALVAVLALLLAACGDDTTGSTGSSSPTETAESPEPSESAGDESGGEEEYTVEAASSDLGEIVTDDSGRTLYVFRADTSTESTCYDDCAATWPARPVDRGPTDAGDDCRQLGPGARPHGADGAQLSRALRLRHRQNGSKQS